MTTNLSIFSVLMLCISTDKDKSEKDKSEKDKSEKDKEPKDDEKGRRDLEVEDERIPAKSRVRGRSV